MAKGKEKGASDEVAKRRLTLKKSRYQSRYSILDDFLQEASIRQTKFKGLYRIILILLILYLLINAVVSLKKKGQIFVSEPFQQIAKQIPIFALIWASLSIYSSVAFFLQKLILLGMPSALVFIFKHLTQALPFAFALFQTLKMQSSSSLLQTFTVVQVIIHYLKVSSYTLTNRDLRREYLKEKQNSKTTSSYPNNINLRNFAYFMAAPTLCYEMNYPQRTQIRPFYIVFKLALALLTILMMYMIASEQLLPLLHHLDSYSWGVGLLKLLFPVNMIVIGFFLLVFDFLLNIYGQLTYFADRQFYQDFWNSTGFEEFSRKWNGVVHEYLYRHVLLQCYNEYKFSHFASISSVFLFSMILHELILFIVFEHCLSCYLSFEMLWQFPLIQMMTVIENTYNGNLIFWLGILIGQPMIIQLYYYETLNFRFTGA